LLRLAAHRYARAVRLLARREEDGGEIEGNHRQLAVRGVHVEVNRECAVLLRHEGAEAKGRNLEPRARLETGAARNRFQPVENFRGQGTRRRGREVELFAHGPARQWSSKLEASVEVAERGHELRERTRMPRQYGILFRRGDRTHHEAVELERG